MKYITGHKTYDRASHGYITVGSVVSGGQYSTYIRGYKEVECNGYMSEQGHLQKFDLDSFKWANSYFRDKIRELASGSDSVIAYCIRHYNGDDRMIHGYIITDTDYNVLWWTTANNTNKSYIIMLTAIKAVGDDAKAYYQQLRSSIKSL